MKRLTAALCLIVSLSMFISTTALSDEHNNISAYFGNDTVDAELYHNGEIVDLKTFEIKNPKDKIAVLFNHGTSSNFKISKCRPNRFPVSLNFLKTKTIGKKNF